MVPGSAKNWLIAAACSTAMSWVGARGSTPVAPDPSWTVEYIHLDTELVMFLKQLQAYRETSPERFDDIVDNLDRILHRFSLLVIQQEDPIAEDRVEVFFFMKATEKSLEVLLRDVNRSLSAKDTVIVHRLYAQIRSRLMEYFTKIMWATRE